MIFEEGLSIELGSIVDLTEKIFPIIAPQKTEQPFVIYKKDNVKFKKTFDGISNKAEAIYSLVLVEKDYAKLQRISSDVISKLLSLQGRPIAAIGPVIENITAEILGDKYEYELDNFRQDIQIKVNY